MYYNLLQKYKENMLQDNQDIAHLIYMFLENMKYKLLKNYINNNQELNIHNVDRFLNSAMQLIVDYKL